MPESGTTASPVEPAFASPLDLEAHGTYAVPFDSDKPLYQFRDRIRADGSTPYAPQAGRYHLYLAIGCPWSQRAAIAVGLTGLTDTITKSLVDDLRDGRGWAFREARGPDPVNGFRTLKEAYLATDPGFEGHVNAPSLWDRKTGRVVNNENDDIVHDIISQFGALARGLDIYPAGLRLEIDALGGRIGKIVNIGVYRIGMAQGRAEYGTGVTQLFALLDELDARLADRRFLFGNILTDCDIRLWVSLARFDIAYGPLFGANLRRLVDYPNLWPYARDLYTLPPFRELSDFPAIKRVYYRTFGHGGPSGIVPLWPIIDWDEPQDRARLGNISSGGSQ